MKLYLFILLGVIAVGCNQTDNTSISTNDTTEQTVNSKDEVDTAGNASNGIVNVQDYSGCYIRVLNRDTLTASLKQSSNNITGKLTFDNYQKDGSSGKVEGTVEDGIMKLIYSFQSEGMNSVMEVYFKADGNSLIRGVGEIKVKGDTAMYANPASISYPSGERLDKVACTSLAEKYR